MLRVDRRVVLVLVALGALSMRVSSTLYFGEEYFWNTGYREYYNLARSIVEGSGYCRSFHNIALEIADLGQDISGEECAHWPPVYPLFLSVVTMGDNDYVSIILTQALVGVGTILCAFLLGNHIFGYSTGILAALIAALYPYYVSHDTSIQETGIFTFSTILSVFLLYKAASSRSLLLWSLSGISLGVTTLIRTSVVLFDVLVVLWVIMVVKGGFRARIFAMLALVTSFALVLIPWMARNTVVLGKPLLTTQTGRFLWIGNNSATFSHYPTGYIDQSEGKAWRGLTYAELDKIRDLSVDEIGQSEWFFNRGTDFILQNPGLTLQRAGRKIWAGFSWNFSPEKDPLRQQVYFFSYFPLLVLGIVGILLTWRRWRELSLIYFLFLAFILVTAVFWAHTSHRSYLDVYLMVFAAYTCTVIYQRSSPWIFRCCGLTQRWYRSIE